MWKNPRSWRKGGRAPQLVFLSAPYRRIHAPLLKLMKELAEKNPDRTIAVLIPELVRRPTGGNGC